MSGPVVETRYGKVLGIAQDGVLRFAGIPFAQARRWRMPERPSSWTGIRDATRFGLIAVQDENQPGDILKGPPGPHGEDCLNLNIWTPGCDLAKRPVMVWIYGGGFTAGASSIGAYDGAPLARRGDVVVVSINYRLGAFGFLNLRDATSDALPGTGAEGIADQIAALKWVRENISAFGGDPANVTVFGESAGGASVCALMASSMARGLFRKAICESAAAHVGTAREESAKFAHAFLEKLGVVRNPRDALDLPLETILAAQQALLAAPPAGTPRLPFGPTADGDILPSRAIDAIRAGSAANIALLAGTARDEARLMLIADEKMRAMTAKSLARRAKGFVDEARAQKLIDAYGEPTPADQYAAMLGDNTFWLPTIKLLEAQDAFAPSFAYRIDWPSPMRGGMARACHVIEIGFVFGTYARDDVAYFFGTGPEADALSRAMMDCWIAFARSGNPSTPALDWPRYDAKRRATMIFGDGPAHVMDDPARARRLAWDS